MAEPFDCCLKRLQCMRPTILVPSHFYVEAHLPQLPSALSLATCVTIVRSPLTYKMRPVRTECLERPCEARGQIEDECCAADFWLRKAIRYCGGCTMIGSLAVITASAGLQCVVGIKTPCSSTPQSHKKASGYWLAAALRHQIVSCTPPSAH